MRYLPESWGRRSLLGLVALVGMLGTFMVGSATAGSFDYWLYAKNDYRSRNVAHDYHYLRSQQPANGIYLCVRRNSTGSSFCGWNYADKHYVDHCNPSSCYSQYGGFDAQDPLFIPMDIHDEWY